MEDYLFSSLKTLKAFQLTMNEEISKLISDNPIVRHKVTEAASFEMVSYLHTSYGCDWLRTYLLDLISRKAKRDGEKY